MALDHLSDLPLPLQIGHVPNGSSAAARAASFASFSSGSTQYLKSNVESQALSIPILLLIWNSTRHASYSYSSETRTTLAISEPPTEHLSPSEFREHWGSPFLLTTLSP